MLDGLRALWRSPESRDDRAQVAAVERAGCRRIASVSDRERVRLTGIITSLVIPPASQAARTEADLWDGSGAVTLVWMGRTQLADIRPGARLVAEGRVSVTATGRTMYNPRYTVIGGGA